MIFRELEGRQGPRFPLNYIIILSLWSSSNALSLSNQEQIDLLPLSWSRYEPLHRQNREVKACQPVLYDNVTHTKHVAATPHAPGSTSVPLVENHYFLTEVGPNYWDKRPITVRQQVVTSPLNTLSILEPGHPGTCKNGTDGRTLVRETAKQNDCMVAINAGLFNTHTGACLGNIVSDGVFVQDSGGIQNAHFGLTEDGHIFTGYLSEMDLLAEDFTQLVGGVMWLVKDGVSYVDKSLEIECPDTQETGSLERFTNVVSARTAIGHDAQGRVHLVEVDGKTDQRGINLHEMAELLIKRNIINAINLDGGGSATAVINGTLVNYPSDRCVNSPYNCERPVTTIVCVHAPHCKPKDCSGHGTCNMGTCQCHGFWKGSDCSKLKCPEDCNWHGTCTEDGCKCKPGWSGIDCSLPCPSGFYGENCATPCFCENGASCSPVTGNCLCAPGFSGKYCQSPCPVGFYGEKCHQVCFCEDTCFCDPVSGNCTDPIQIDSEFIKAGQCIAGMEIKKQNLIPSTEDQSGLWLTTVLCLSTLGVSSLLLNALLSLTLIRSRHRHQAEKKRAARLAVKHALRRVAKGIARHNSENDDEDEDEESQFMEEPLTSSSDSAIYPNQQTKEQHTVSERDLSVKTEPQKQRKRLAFKKLFPVKNVRRKPRSPPKSTPFVDLTKKDMNSEQLFPLLGKKQNGSVGLPKEEYSSSDKDVEDLFIAPQRKNEFTKSSR